MRDGLPRSWLPWSMASLLFMISITVKIRDHRAAWPRLVEVESILVQLPLLVLAGLIELDADRPLSAQTPRMRCQVIADGCAHHPNVVGNPMKKDKKQAVIYNRLLNASRRVAARLTNCYLLHARLGDHCRKVYGRSRRRDGMMVAHFVAASCILRGCTFQYR